MDYHRHGSAAFRLEDVVGAEAVDLEGLRKGLASVPFCTTNRKGTRDGDPLNLAFVATNKKAAEVGLMAGWLLTESTNAGSTWRTIRAFLSGKPYRHSPNSPLYAYGRRHDAGMQKIRWSIHERNHLRAWRSPWHYEGKYVHLVQVSRDIGVRLTRRTRILTTHKIDPDVDHARDSLVMDYSRLGFVERLGWLQVGEPSSPDAPRRNLTGDRWWSDGLRAVIFISDEPMRRDFGADVDWGPPPPL